MIIKGVLLCVQLDLIPKAEAQITRPWDGLAKKYMFNFHLICIKNTLLNYSSISTFQLQSQIESCDICNSVMSQATIISSVKTDNYGSLKGFFQ